VKRGEKIGIGKMVSELRAERTNQISISRFRRNWYPLSIPQY